MGAFRIDCEIVNPRQPRRNARVRQLLVDSGSEFTWVPGDVLDRIGIRVVKKDQQFVLANGQTITRSVGYAIIRVAEFETIDEVVFAQPRDLSLLGARTLEGFGAHVDARQKRLLAAGPHLAAGRPPAVATLWNIARREIDQFVPAGGGRGFGERIGGAAIEEQAR